MPQHYIIKYAMEQNETYLTIIFNYSQTFVKCLCATEIWIAITIATMIIYQSDISLQLQELSAMTRISILYLQQRKQMLIPCLFHHHRSEWSFKKWNEWNPFTIIYLQTKQEDHHYLETIRQNYKWTRIFTTPWVVELSMRSILSESIPVTYHNHAEDPQSLKSIQNAM